MISNPLTSDSANTTVRILVSDGKPIDEAAARLIVEKERNVPLETNGKHGPLLQSLADSQKSKHAKATTQSIGAVPQINRPAYRYDDLASKALSIVDGGEVALIKPEGVPDRKFQQRVLNLLGHRADTRKWRFSLRNAGCNRFLLTCRGEDPKPAALKAELKARRKAKVEPVGNLDSLKAQNLEIALESPQEALGVSEVAEVPSDCTTGNVGVAIVILPAEPKPQIAARITVHSEALKASTPCVDRNYSLGLLMRSEFTPAESESDGRWERDAVDLAMRRAHNAKADDKVQSLVDDWMARFRINKPSGKCWLSREAIADLRARIWEGMGK